MNFSNTRYYNILGVSRDSTLGVITEAFNKKLFNSKVEDLNLVFEAYRVLSSIELRKKYDEFLEKNNIENNSSISIPDTNINKNLDILDLELNEIEYYSKNIENEINRLISKPYSKYKLNINIKKYENQVKLLDNILENRKSSLTKNKLEIYLIEKHLENLKLRLNQFQNI